MDFIKLACAGVFVASVCGAQNVTISGTVKNGAGVGITGAVVKLEKGRQTATTGAGGSFTLSGPPVAIQRKIPAVQPQQLHASLGNGYLLINGGGESPLEIIAFNVRGEIAHMPIQAGVRSIPLPCKEAGVYVYAIRSGGNEILLRSCSVNERRIGSAEGPFPRPLAKQAQSAAAINDVIIVTKSGYLDYRVMVTNSDTSGIGITMLASAGTVADIDGNVYQTVKIGNQEWTVQNLRTTKLNDGTPIPNVKDSLAWYLSPVPAYCTYDTTANVDTIRKYGFLYNWFAVGSGKLAPAGWHVPADSEWDTLQDYLIAHGYNWDGTTADNKIAKSMAAKAYWNVSSAAQGLIGNDLTLNTASGFSAIPAGYRMYYSIFVNKGFVGYWWTTTELDGAAFAKHRFLSFDAELLDMVEVWEKSGFSVRLVKD